MKKLFLVFYASVKPRFTHFFFTPTLHQVLIRACGGPLIFS